MYSRECIFEAISKICDRFGLIAYECFDFDGMILKIKIEDQHGNVIDTIKIDRYSFNKDTLDRLWDKLSNKPAEKRVPTKAVMSPNSYRTYLGLDPIIPVDKDKQIVKILEGKSVIIQFDAMLKAETIKLLREDIQNQIRENEFAVVDGRCKIVEFDNPKFIFETK